MKHYPSDRVARYRLWTYDLWADGDGGYSVNDRCDRGIFEIPCSRTVFNEGTPDEFEEVFPSDEQLNAAVSGDYQWDGESDYTLYATADNGDPACELEFVGYAEQE